MKKRERGLPRLGAVALSQLVDLLFSAPERSAV